MKIMKNSMTWTWHLLAGVALAFLLGTHMFIMHLDDVFKFVGGDAAKAVSFAAVVERGKQISFMVSYVLLLAAALYHGLYGLRTIIFELTLAPRAEKAITRLFVVIGVALFVYSAVVAISAYRA
jgi:succinate dehydrogenase / fumarate reductase membrane anchor subunit